MGKVTPITAARIQARAVRLVKGKYHDFGPTLAGCRVIVCEHLDGSLSVSYGPHVVGRYRAAGAPLDHASRTKNQRGGHDAPWKAWKTQKPGFPAVPTALGNPAQNAGFPHAHSADGDGQTKGENRTDHVLQKADIFRLTTAKAVMDRVEGQVARANGYCLAPRRRVFFPSVSGLEILGKLKTQLKNRGFGGRTVRIDWSAAHRAGGALLKRDWKEAFLKRGAPRGVTAG